MGYYHWKDFETGKEYMSADRRDVIGLLEDMAGGGWYLTSDKGVVDVAVDAIMQLAEWEGDKGRIDLDLVPSIVDLDRLCDHKLFVEGNKGRCFD